MPDTIKTIPSSPELQSPATLEYIFSDLNNLTRIMNMYFWKVKELTLIFIELKKRNPIIIEKIQSVEKSMQSLTDGLLDEVNFLNETIKEKNKMSPAQQCRT